ncbi:hypothetical protein H9L39_04547 [Fusarium oxysporum f. sp. albedinis]|nr:hypothetical protein H9L39_04547 [Fusarium oxysporum f. sp. albedinis]
MGPRIESDQRNHEKLTDEGRLRTVLYGPACATAQITVISFDQRLLLWQNLSIMLLLMDPPPQTVTKIGG